MHIEKASVRRAQDNDRCVRPELLTFSELEREAASGIADNASNLLPSFRGF